MKERLLIIGGSGLLGSNIVRTAAQNFEVYASYYSHPVQISSCSFMPLDIKDRHETLSLLRKVRPELVIHTAALVDVDYCEEHPGEAWLINADGAENVALASKKVGAKLIYISTDSVFDGEKGMYTEADVPHPINIYAKTKREGEIRVQRSLPDSLIIRTAFYSWSLPGRHSLAEWVITELKKENSLRMFTDVFFSPIPADALVEAMLEMYRKGLTGIYHVGGTERCSKYAFGLEIARIFGFNDSYIQPSTLAEAKLKAPRPKDLSLNISKVVNSANIHLPNLREGIFQLKVIANESEIDQRTADEEGD